jgi:hypothetical protein
MALLLVSTTAYAAKAGVKAPIKTTSVDGEIHPTAFNYCISKRNTGTSLAM